MSIDASLQPPPDDKREERNLKWMVLRHLMRREEIIQAFGETIFGSLYFTEYPTMRAIFNLIWPYWKTYGALLPIELLSIDLPTALENEKIHDPENIVLKILLSWYRETKWQDAFVREHLTDYIKTTAVDVLQTKIQHATDTSEAQLHIQDALETMSFADKGEIKTENPFSNAALYLSTAVRLSLGVQYLDLLTDGGLALGEALVIIGPSGGGKSTIGLQIASEVVIRRQHVLYISTEQDLRGDLSARIYTLATHGHRKEFEQGWEKVSQESKDKIKLIKPLWSEFFSFCDLSNVEISGIEQVEQVIIQRVKEKKSPSLIVLDWWGRLRDIMDMFNFEQLRKGGDQLRRTQGRMWLFKLVKMASRYNFRLVVLHQMAGADARKGARALPSSWSGQEDKNLNNMFQFAVALGRKNELDEVVVVADKARSTANKQTRLKLDGQQCRFVYAENSNMTVHLTPREATNAEPSIG